jgi:hypothetical protein
VALESINEHNYKAESLQDVKNFANKVLQAIKKAFLALWNKIMGFFKDLSKKNDDIQKEANELANQATELEREASKAPKSAGQAKDYSSDYFGVKKNYFDEVKPSGVPALGYTPGTSNKTHVGGFVSKDKDVDYSDNTYDPLGASGSGSEYYSVIVYNYLGAPNSTPHTALDRRIKQFSDQVNGLQSKLSLLVSSVKYGAAYPKGGIDIPELPYGSKDIDKRAFAIGNHNYELLVEDYKIKLNISSSGSVDKYGIQTTPLADIKNKFVPLISDLTAIVETGGKFIDEEFKRAEEWIAHQESTIEENNENFEGKNEQLVLLRENFTKVLEYVQSGVRAHAALSRYIQVTCKAILMYMRQRINNIKRKYEHYIKQDGYIRDIREIEQQGWVNG